MGSIPKYSGKCIETLKDIRLRRNASNMYNIRQVNLWLAGNITGEQLKDNIKEV